MKPTTLDQNEHLDVIIIEVGRTRGTDPLDEEPVVSLARVR